MALVAQVASDLDPISEADAPSARIARAIGWWLHPFVVAVPVGIYGCSRLLGLGPLQIAGLAAVTIAATVGLPVLVIVLLHRAGWIEDDLLMRNRQNRRFVYPVMLVGFLLDAAVFTWLVPSRLGCALTAAAFAVTLALFLANFATKVSLHCAGHAGILVALLAVYGPVAAWLGLALPVMVWARVTSKNHTLVQTLLGIVLGAAPVALVMAFGFPELAPGFGLAGGSS
ncbi:MAG: hypothetical protein ACYS22_16840 [Planctomycetota bacterium]|jgi:hypothetical protein